MNRQKRQTRVAGGLAPGAVILALLLVLGATSPASARQELDLTRRYEVGQRFQYRLAQTETRGDQTSRVEAVSDHEVVADDDGGPPFERVRWLSLGEPGEADDIAARALAPYTLALGAEEQLESPRPAGSVALLGMVTDLQTFYVAVSRGLGLDKLKAVGDAHVRPELIIGDFEDGEAILSGRDCTRATLRLVAVEEDEVTVEARFEPPSQSCLDPAATPAAGEVPENFRMVRRAGPGVLDLHGHESFVILSRLRRSDGQLRAADMTNQLDLEGRMCADVALAACNAIPPIHRNRRVSLELIEAN